MPITNKVVVIPPARLGPGGASFNVVTVGSVPYSVKATSLDVGSGDSVSTADGGPIGGVSNAEVEVCTGR